LSPGVERIVIRANQRNKGYSRWLEHLLVELRFELWTGDPAETKAKRVMKQKTDREDARLLVRRVGNVMRSLLLRQKKHIFVHNLESGKLHLRQASTESHRKVGGTI
jgi:hypothetical protein